MPTPLPVIAILRDAFQFVWDKRARMLRALLILTGAMVVLEYLPSWMDWELTGPYADEITWMWCVYFLVQTIPFVLFAITCHRLALMGDSGVPAYGNLSWGKRESIFMGWLLVVLIITTLVSLVFSGLMIGQITYDLEHGEGEAIFRMIPFWLIDALYYLPTLYLFSRFSILYPAIALDHKVSMKWAWNLTAGNGWRLTLLVGILPWVFYYPLSSIYREDPTLIETVLLKLVGFIFLAVEIVVVSFSYKHLTTNVESPAKAGDGRNRVFHVQSVLIERLYLGASVFLFMIFLVFHGGPFRHGTEVLVVFFGLAWFFILFSGLFLALKAAGERKAMFVILTATVFLTAGYPYWF